MEREKAVSEMLELGYSGIIKIVNKKYLGKEFLGKKLDKILVEKIRATGADICGENGEYHTFVTDGPMYQNPVLITLGDIVDFGDYAAIEIKPL
jgi:diphthamide synthase (EF-2-diphthine--ammonia ligase)